jgi:hypothetical protein
MALQPAVAGGIHFQGGGGKSFSIRVIRVIRGSDFGFRA